MRQYYVAVNTTTSPLAISAISSHGLRCAGNYGFQGGGGDYYYGCLQPSQLRYQRNDGFESAPSTDEIARLVEPTQACAPL